MSGPPGRLWRDESGVALGLAAVVVVLVGIMGAGLLAVVAADLQGMAEINRGRQAFEMAEAGVEVAKARLAEEPDADGWTSDELRLEGVEKGSVVVSVEREGSLSVAISVGRCDDATRVVEAVFAVEEGESRLLSWRECHSLDCGR